MDKFSDISNQKFGKLLALQRTSEKRWGVYLWLCLCDCGKTKVAPVNSLKSGLVRSCGCLSKDRASLLKTHGMYGTTEYKTWSSMIQRCTNPKSRQYKQYGGKGISVCDRWKNSFEEFYRDMGKKPPNMSLDRIDPSKGYELQNCRWADKFIQARNKRKSKTSFEQAEIIRNLYKNGLGPKKISEITGLRKTAVEGVIYLGTVSQKGSFSLPGCTEQYSI